MSLASVTSGPVSQPSLAALDMRHVTRACRKAMRYVVPERMRQFGHAGHAGDYEPRSLEDMRRMYEAQEPTGAAA